MKNEIIQSKTFQMKRLLFMMTIVSSLAVLTISSCNKDDSLPPPPRNPPITLYMTAFLSSLNKILIPSGYANYSVKVYLVTDSNDILINSSIYYVNGEVTATITATDVTISYGGSAPYLNIKVVIE